MTKRKNIILLHLAVLLFSVSGVIGQYVEIPAVLVTAGRVLCSSILLLLFSIVKREKLTLDSRKDYLLIIMVGVVMAIHWTSFFQSIQVSSVAIGTITFSTFPLFLTFIEPVVFKERLRLKSVLCAMVLLVGVFITIPEFSMENQVTVGIIWGMLCSFTYAIMTLGNRYFSRKYTGRIICLYEQGTAAIVLLPSFFLVQAQWRVVDIAGIATIGFVCTAIAYSLYVMGQKGVRAQTAGIISGMETVYGIVIAFFALHEIPTARDLLGGAVILGVALYTSLQTD